jgi:hypothetical protein
MCLLEYPQATSFSTANLESEQKLLKSKIANCQASYYTRSRYDRTISSNIVYLDALLVDSIKHCFSHYLALSQITALLKIEVGRARLGNITGIYLHTLPECRLLCCKSHYSFQITWSLATNTIVELGRVRSKPSTLRYTCRRTYLRSIRFC